MKTAGPLIGRVRAAVQVGFTHYCSILLLLTSALPAYAFLVREPYLQLVTPTSVTVVWRTDLAVGNDSLGRRIRHDLRRRNEGFI